MASTSAMVRRPLAADTAPRWDYQDTTSASSIVPPEMCPIFAAAKASALASVPTALNQKPVSSTYQQAKK
jgi:hypothetical protein